jgi:penicillin-binding protein 2
VRPRRALVIQAVVLSMMATLGGRLWYLQTVASPQYVAAANANTVREVVTPAPRGIILDDQAGPWPATAAASSCPWTAPR